MTASLHALARTLAFLSRTPPLPAAYGAPSSLGADSPLFPVAGLLIAAPAALLLLGLDAAGLSAPVAALSAVAFLVWATVALHEDGLADTADALFGHHSRERALAIMRDSRIGTYGAAALILALGARVLLLAEALQTSATASALALLAAAAASRGAMAHLWASLPPAEPDGLAVRVGRPSAGQGALSLGIALAILVSLGAPAAGWLGLLLPALLALLAHFGFRAFLKSRLGGQTGDTIGCDQQLVEISILLGFALAL